MDLGGQGKRIACYGRRARVASIAAAAVAACAVGTPKTSASNAAYTTTAASAFNCASYSASNRPDPIICGPASSTTAPKRPLVIALYGSGGSPSLMESLTHLNEVARQHGFVVAYPASSSPNHPWKPFSDVTYLSSLIDQLIATQNIDPNRVYVTGFSAGGFETWRAGCNLSTKVAAVAVVAGNMGRKYSRVCMPARPISQLLMVGTADGQRWTGIPGVLLSPKQTTNRWLQIDGCTSGRPNQIQRPVPAVTQDTWASCVDGSAVALYIIGGAGHVWPLGGPGTPANYSASEAIWAFFASQAPTPLSLPSTDAQVSSVGVTRLKGRLAVVARFRLAEPFAVVEQVTGPRRRVAHRKFQLHSGVMVLTKLNLPLKAKAGTYTVSLALKDSYGRALKYLAPIRVP